MQYDINAIIEKLEEYISAPRMEHTLGTRDKAAELAARYGVERNRASIAALLHDCARDFPVERLLNMAGEEGLPVDETERQIPVLLHGPVGAVIARKDFGVSDLQVLRAISVHTTGAGEMSSLDKIIYVADKVERTRNYEGVEELREKTYAGLDEALCACLEHSIKYSLQRKTLLHPSLCHARNGILMEIIQKSTQISCRNF